MEENKFLNVDCIEYMKTLPDNFVDVIFTDIPYDVVNRKTNGIRAFNVGVADTLNFDIDNFLNECYRITKSSITIFCGKEQFSEIFSFFGEKQKMGKGTVRELVWKKTNPSPVNGQYIYLNGIETAVWFKKRGGVFNAHCKNTVFEYPVWSGKNRIHPTEKHHGLIKEIILDNTNEGDLVFDPCAGSGSTLLVAKENNRRFLGCELDKDFYEKALKRLEDFKEC